MTQTKIGGVVAIVALVAVVAGNVFAQDKAERREKLRKAAGVAAELATEIAEDAAKGGGEMITGSVLIVRDKTKGELRVNKGGLVIVKIQDSGSRPVEHIKVDGGATFKQIGQVRPTKMKAGGVDTWILLKAVAEGDASISASYSTEESGEPTEWQHTVMVTPAE